MDKDFGKECYEYTYYLNVGWRIFWSKTTANVCYLLTDGAIHRFNNIDELKDHVDDLKRLCR